jgi:hypothetical protein
MHQVTSPEYQDVLYVINSSRSHQIFEVQQGHLKYDQLVRGLDREVGYDLLEPC